MTAENLFYHGTNDPLPLIVQTTNVERLRLIPDGWICIGGITPETAPIAIRTMTGEVRINKPGEIAPHAEIFFECLNVIFPAMRAKWIAEETERCAKIAATMHYCDIPKDYRKTGGYGFSSEEYEFGWQEVIAAKIRSGAEPHDSSCSEVWNNGQDCRHAKRIRGQG